MRLRPAEGALTPNTSEWSRCDRSRKFMMLNQVLFGVKVSAKFGENC